MRIPQLCYAVVLVLPAFFAGCSDNATPHKTEIDPAFANDLGGIPAGPVAPIPGAGGGAAQKQVDHVGDLKPMMPPG